MQIIDALRLYANYLLDTPGTGVALTGEPFPLARDKSTVGGGLDVKTVKKVLGLSVGKVSEAAILHLCRIIAFDTPYVKSHYLALFDEPLPVNAKVLKKDLIGKTDHSQIAIDAILRIAASLKQQLQHKDNLPYARNKLFTGRETLLQDLHQSLQTQRFATLSSASLKGLGGVGKTQLALEYAYRFYEHYQHVFWISADGESALREDLAALAKLLMLPEHKLMQDKIDAVLDWLANNSSWLLVVDNAENLEHINLVAKYFNFATTGMMIITTRTEAPGRFSTPFPVDVFSDEEGALFLEKRTNKLSSEDKPDADAMAISQRLGGLALALEQAGAYIEQRGIGFKDYLGLYEANAPELLKRPIDLDYDQSTYGTFSISFEKIQAKNPLAAELLADFSMCAPDGIPVFDLYPEIPQLELFDAIAVLRDYSIIKWHEERKMVSIHRVVQDIIKDVVLG